MLYMTDAEIIERHGEDDGSYVSIRTLWVCKDVSSPSGYQGAKFSVDTWSGLQRTKSISKPYCDHVVDRYPQFADLMDQVSHDRTPYTLPSSLPSGQRRLLARKKGRQFEHKPSDRS